MLNKRLFRSVLVAMVIVVFAFAMGTSESMAAAMPTCQQLHGNLQTQVIGAGETQGTITHGGLLNGTTHDHITVTSTTSSATTYTATFQDTTDSGTIVTQDIGQFYPDGTFVEHGTIDENASTGRFAGATGSLTFIGSSTDGVHFTASVSGEISTTNH